jgi:uncharacterized protein (TIGR03435 family)
VPKAHEEHSAFSNDASQCAHSVVDRPIVDKTNLPGLYDVSLRFAPESDPLSGGPVTATPPGIPTTSSDPAAPPLFSAIQDQLGVKLQPGTGTVEVIVIDTVQKPSEN